MTRFLIDRTTNYRDSKLEGDKYYIRDNGVAFWLTVKEMKELAEQFYQIIKNHKEVPKHLAQE